MANISRVKTKAPLKSNMTVKNKAVVKAKKADTASKPKAKKENSDVKLRQELKTKSNSDVKIKTPKKATTRIALRVKRGSTARIKV